ncbi:MAG: hypothetical protein BMS9Abin37_0172 [Acidobacteriota bacterium]|nr:MAG: hypothetical protein BMS9Abin37_0172 [Acidobacteriota bacterium]
MQEPIFFSDTLSAGREEARLRHWLSAPLGVAVHGLALAAIAVMSLLSVPEHLTPNALSATVLQFAPPSPPVLVRGGSLEQSSQTPAPLVSSDARTFVPTPAFAIPDEMLTATLPMADVPAAIENGFDDGDLNGMFGGMPGGVVGGVPGGLIGGVIGGTGTELPQFPTPDVGPRPLRMPPASYTEEAIRQNVQGSVKLHCVIDEQGKVRVLEVLRSIPELDEEAIRTVESSWRFQPAMKNGRPISCLSHLVVRFNLY